MRKPLILILTIFISAPHACADILWKNMGSNINCREFNCVVVDVYNPGFVYVGTSNGVYMTEDSGLNWKRIFTGWGRRKNIRHIYIEKEKVFLCTDRGLFISKDKGKSWRPSFGIASRGHIFSVTTVGRDTPVIFIVTDAGVFKSQYGKREWRRVFSSDGAGEGGAVSSLPKARAISRSFKHPSRIYLGTENGVYISDNTGESFKRFIDEGLAEKDILFLLEPPIDTGIVYAVAKNGIFYYCDVWHRLISADTLSDAKCIAIDLNSKNSMWVATKKGVYRSIVVATDEEEIGAGRRLKLSDYFNDEPTIGEIQEAAIRYAEVHSDKIRSWRRRASVRALLPRLSLGIDRSESDTYEIYTSSTRQYAVEGPKKNSDGWDLTFTWDLGDLIWSDDQTSIDIRSKLMVQLRDDILDEVTSYYFERKRLQIELLEAPLKNERDRIRKELRIQELTANIDALTGGYFSQNLK